MSLIQLLIILLLLAAAIGVIGAGVYIALTLVRLTRRPQTKLKRSFRH